MIHKRQFGKNKYSAFIIHFVTRFGEFYYHYNDQRANAMQEALVESSERTQSWIGSKSFQFSVLRFAQLEREWTINQNLSIGKRKSFDILRIVESIEISCSKYISGVQTVPCR